MLSADKMIANLILLVSLFAVASAMFDFPCPQERSAIVSSASFCEKSTIDDVLLVPPNMAYFFKDDQIALRLENRSIAYGYPKPIVKLFPGLPSNIDAAFSYSITSKTYFLKGSQYWRYTNNALDEGFPRTIAEGFAGVPDNVDSATEWDKYIYFFKGSLYYKYDPCKNESYAVPISDFIGIPKSGGISGIYRSHVGLVHFFKGELYYDFNLGTGKSSVPLVTGMNWFGCKWD